MYQVSIRNSLRTNNKSDLDLRLCVQRTRYNVDYSEARNDQGRRVQQESKNEYDETAPFWIAWILFFCRLWKGAILEPKKILHNKQPDMPDCFFRLQTAFFPFKLVFAP